jgi:hypothetical protein
MISLEESEKRLRILKKAREALAVELLKKHNEAFATWQQECEDAWLKDKKLLPYLVQSYYPTEIEIVNKAVELYKATIPVEGVEIEIEPESEDVELETIDEFVKKQDVVSITAFAKNKNKKDS